MFSSADSKTGKGVAGVQGEVGGNAMRSSGLGREAEGDGEGAIEDVGDVQTNSSKSGARTCKDPRVGAPNC